MNLPKPEKLDAVSELKERLQNSQVAIASTYIGINVGDVTSLRKRMRDSGIEYKVYKNTLARIALRDLGMGEGEFMEGPTAWAFSEDPVAPAKILKDFAKENKFVTMRGGILSGKPVDSTQLESLADLPSREQLLGQIAGLLQSPLANMAGALNALPQNVAGLIDALQQKQEGKAA